MTLKLIRTHFKLIVFSTLVIFCVTISGIIFQGVWRKDPGVTSFDLEILNKVIENRTEFFNNLFIFITNFGDFLYVLLIFLLISAFLLYKRKYLYTSALTLILLGDAFFIFTLKAIVQRARPDVLSAVIKETGFSFPSGHTFISTCFYGLLTYFVFKNVQNLYLKILSIAVGVLIIFLISFSRIYLGVHWFSDVTASFLFSAAFLILMIYFLENRTTKKKT
jgi:membrane-associated phospholipid phosphatase